MDKVTGMVVRAAVVAVLVLGGGSQDAIACMCSPDSMKRSFTDVASRSELVVRARVESHDDRKGAGSSPIALSMTLSVLSTLKGSAAPREQVKVWGDNGILCRPYVARFPVGTEWVFVLARGPRGGHMPDPNPSPGPLPEYVIGGCGPNWLPVADGKVRGRISEARSEQEMDYVKLTELLARDKGESTR